MRWGFNVRVGWRGWPLDARCCLSPARPSEKPACRRIAKRDSKDKDAPFRWIQAGNEAEE